MGAQSGRLIANASRLRKESEGGYCFRQVCRDYIFAYKDMQYQRHREKKNYKI
jgi:hypothetical protein